MPRARARGRRVLVAYATTHGHTAKIAAAIGAAIEAAGAQPTVVDTASPSSEVDVDTFDGVIVAASLHAGGYQSELRNWVTRRARSLNPLPTAFVSVCLGVLQDDPKVQDELAHLRERFFNQTGWRPATVLPVAGALAYSQYNFVTRTIMRRIAAQAGGDTDTSRDHEYTDWPALAASVRAFVRALGPARRRAG